MEVVINYARPDKKCSIFREVYVNETTSRVKTRTELPNETGESFVEKWQDKGLITGPYIPATVTKYYFFNQYFDILIFKEINGSSIGHYCDIVTPTVKRDGEYFLTDLFLDVWITPDNQLIELDIDEFEVACENGIISNNLRECALTAFERIKYEFTRGVFPSKYLD